MVQTTPLSLHVYNIRTYGHYVAIRDERSLVKIFVVFIFAVHVTLKPTKNCTLRKFPAIRRAGCGRIYDTNYGCVTSRAKSTEKHISMDGNALYRNCRLGNKAVVADLLAEETNVRLVDPQNEDTPLHWVCWHGWLDIFIKFIKEYGCDLQDHCNLDKCQLTPIHHIFQQAHRDIALYLINEYGCTEIVHKLLQLRELSQKDSRCILSKVMKFSISNGVWKPDDKNSDGNTVLHLACKANRQDVVALLISEFKCNQNIPNNDGKTPIQLQFCNTFTSILHHDKITSSDAFFERFSIALSSMSCDQCIELLTLSLNNSNCTWKPDDKTSNGNTALHLACRANKPEIVIFLLKEAKCNPNIANNDGNTPIKVTRHFGIMYNLIFHGAIVEAIVVCSLVNTPLSQQYELSDLTKRIVDLLRMSLNKSTWNPDEKAFDGSTVLHYACKADRLSIVDFLLSEAKCDPNIKNNNGKTPIQLTSNLEIIEMLINHGGTTTSDIVFKLLFRIEDLFKHINDIENVITFFELGINNTTWNPNDRNDEDDTALYVACYIVNHCERHNQSRAMILQIKRKIVHILLSEAHCDPNVISGKGKTPLEVTRDPEVLRDLIRHGAKTDVMYKSHHRALGTNKPLQPPVKVFVVGNPSVGKSTLVAALKKELSLIGRLLTSVKVTDVEEKTAGVIPHEFESSRYGPVTIYDFAGQREFYSSHAALLQTAVQSSPPIFLLVVNLCDSDDEIRQNVLYWLSFLENQCISVTKNPHIILVGSHADKLVSMGENPKKKMSNMDRLSFINLRYAGYVAMDCQFSESSGMNELRQSIMKSCSHLRTRDDITFNAHCFHVYLLDRLRESSAIILSTILTHIKNQQQAMTEEKALYFLPQSIGALYKICNELNDRGHILFLKDLDNAENSWVITDKSVLLSEVTGTIFAPEGFKQHKQLASNTGVVPLSALVSQFPLHDPEMLVGFLTHLEFCHGISDQELLQLISEQCSQSPNERYYLFPGLIALNIPDNVWDTQQDFTYHCGWILQCTCPEQFFDSRFLHVLLLRLAFSFALTKSSEESDGQHPAIHRKCSLWKNGIFWGNRYGVETLVEVLPDNKAVVVLMRYSKDMVYMTEIMNLLSSVIGKVLQCAQTFSPRVKISESLIDRTEVVQYPLKPMSELMHFTIQAVASAAVETLQGQPISVVNSTGVTRSLQYLLTFEPYTELNKHIIQILCSEQSSNKSISDQFILMLFYCLSTSKHVTFFTKIFSDALESVSNSEEQSCTVYGDSKLLQTLRELKDGSERTYQCLRDKLDHFSIFAGRNILV